MFRKAGAFLISMRFALILLGVLVAVCVLGSVIPQGNIESYYTQTYPNTGHLILAVQLDDVFHCWWFCGLTALLCMNLLGCNLLHFPGILRQHSRFYTLASAKQRGMLPLEDLTVSDPDALFRKMGFHTPVHDAGCFYAVRNRAGLWGAWMTHLGMLIIIIGFALGEMFTQKYEVYGVPGQTKPIGDSGYTLTIDDFTVDLREDDTVEQYTAALRVRSSHTGEEVSGESCVNAPLSAFGYSFYQNATGYAADLRVYKDDGDGITACVQEGTLCVGEYAAVEDRPELVVLLRNIYPDFTLDEQGQPVNASDRLVNPGYLYMLYYKGELLGMQVLHDDEVIQAGPYTLLFSNPRMYTLIEIKQDPFSWLTLLGGIVFFFALLLSFYIRTEELWAVREEDGLWRVGGSSRKGGILYRDKLKDSVRALKET